MFSFFSPPCVCGFSKSQTEHPGLLKMKRLDARMWRYNTIRHKTIWQTVDTGDIGCPTPPSLKIYVLRNCSWSDVRCRANSMSTPWGKTYIHETESHRLAVCVGMALQDITVPRFFCKHGVLLNLPAREGWNAWKHHYCALTWPTVNGWVKVPFEMYDV